MPHVYGPVPSHRLNRSLGVDLVPFKTCPYDCVYCQLGRTTDKTLRRRETVRLDDVIDEVMEKLPFRPDYITLGGSGEPTLYSRLGDLIDSLRSVTDIPIAVLTSGALLWQPEVRRELREASLVIPSLDAGDAKTFQAVNRPHRDLTFEQLLEGLIEFREGYWGQYWLEVLLVADYSASESHVRRIAACTERIRPDRVQINTVTRPAAAEPDVAPVDSDRLRWLAQLFPCRAEVISKRISAGIKLSARGGEAAVLDLLRRRPCTVDDVVEALQSHRAEIIKHLDHLHDKRLVERQRAGNRLFYRAARRIPQPLPNAEPESKLRR